MRSTLFRQGACRERGRWRGRRGTARRGGRVSAASAVELWENGQQAGIKAVTAEDLVGAIVCNDVASTDITGEFAGSDATNGMQWHNFTTITATVDLVEGWNEIVFTCTATNGDNFSGLNVDYVELTTTEAKLGWWPIY